VIVNLGEQTFAVDGDSRWQGKQIEFDTLPEAPFAYRQSD
jgi:hypothetical protein